MVYTTVLVQRILEKILKIQKYYRSLNYKVGRIPYFIQLTKKAVKKLFNVSVKEELFDVKYPSLTGKGKNTPAFLCPAGIKRMKEEFKRFPEQ